MTQSNFSDPVSMKEAKLARRDWLLMPLLSLATMCVLACSVEFLAEQVFPHSSGFFKNCQVTDNPSAGLGGVPNAVCRFNNRDTPMTEYRLNGCGHRTEMVCGPKPAGAYRIVLLGSSFTAGEGVPVEKTFAASLPAELSRQTGRAVQIYNEGMFGDIPDIVSQRFNSVMAAEPDMILWILTPHDIKNTSPPLYAIDSTKAAGKGGSEPRVRPGFLARARRGVLGEFTSKPLPEAVAELWQHELDQLGWVEEFSSVMLFRHVLFANQRDYVKSYLMGGRDAGFLKAETDAEWRNHLRQFDIDDASIEAQAKAAGVPLVTVLLPNRAQAAMISMGEWPAGFDPYTLDNELRSIVVSHGGTYLDILPRFRSVVNPEQYFFEVNGHPDAHGHLLVSEMLASELTGGAIPPLKAASPNQAASEQGK